MTTPIIYHFALVLHIAALTIMAGATLADYVTLKQFWKQFATDKPKGLAVLTAMAKFPVLIRIGILLLIVSGITMMGVTHGVFGEQVWFRIKFALVIVIIINGLAIGRRLGMRLRRTVQEEGQDMDIAARLLKLKNSLNWFHISQLALFLVIFVLSVFKFN